MFRAQLWKLNTKGDPNDAADWLLRDMWIANNGSICYYSQKESKRLVLFEASRLHDATIEPLAGSARQFAFTVKFDTEHDHSNTDSLTFAAKSKSEYDTWLQQLEQASLRVMQTMRLGPEVLSEMKKIRATVKNRRAKVADENADAFGPMFKGMLWKVKTDGDRHKETDWFHREMWISNNGSLVYHSVRDDSQLVYFTPEDLATAAVQTIPNEDSFHPWAFVVQPKPSVDDIEFSPAEFAAPSEEMRDQWIAKIRDLQHK